MAKHKSSKQSSSYCPIVSDLIDLGAALALDVFSALLRQRESASKHSYRVDPYAAAGIAAVLLAIVVALLFMARRVIRRFFTRKEAGAPVAAAPDP